VWHYDTIPGNLDTILLNSDVTPADVKLEYNDWNLALSINGTNDTLTVNYFFQDPGFEIEQIQFADGTIWDLEEIHHQISIPTDGNNFFMELTRMNILQGLGGDDYLFGGLGDDTLDGGPGNDYLHDVEGANTYIFNRGGGFDWIDVKLTTDHISGDTVVFGEGITPEDLSIQSGEYYGTPTLAIGIGNNEGIAVMGVSSDSGNLGISDLAVQQFVLRTGRY